jgi:DNA-binding transcriptional LysR family regulator
MKMKLRDFDLNLLVILHELLKQGSVSKAAESLGVSQPAVSNSLNRLRKLLGDDLFLRTSRGFAPTRLADSMTGPIAHALETILSAINNTSGFDPKTSERRFDVGLTDIGEMYCLPDLLRVLPKYGPGIAIRSIRNSSVDLKAEMESGQVDLAIGLLTDLDFGFFQRRLFSQRYVCMFRRNHPLMSQGLTFEAFKSADHISVTSEGKGHSAIEAVLDRAVIKRKIKLWVPQFVAVGPILRSTDLIAVVPETYARRIFESADLIFSPCPVELPETTINILWHAQHHRDPGNRWLRQLIFDQASAADHHARPDFDVIAKSKPTCLDHQTLVKHLEQNSRIS